MRQQPLSKLEYIPSAEIFKKDGDGSPAVWSFQKICHTVQGSERGSWNWDKGLLEGQFLWDGIFSLSQVLRIPQQLLQCMHSHHHQERWSRNVAWLYHQSREGRFQIDIKAASMLRKCFVMTTLQMQLIGAKGATMSLLKCNLFFTRVTQDIQNFIYPAPDFRIQRCSQFQLSLDHYAWELVTEAKTLCIWPNKHLENKYWKVQ